VPLAGEGIAAGVAKHAGTRLEPSRGDASLPLGALALTSSFGVTTKDSRVHWKKRQKEIQRLREKHGTDRSLARQFPDLKVEQRTAPCTNGMRGSTARRAQPPGMKQFPVGHSHKQGLELITPGTDLQWMGGKKT
jgi:hypothetical protein